MLHTSKHVLDQMPEFIHFKIQVIIADEAVLFPWNAWFGATLPNCLADGFAVVPLVTNDNLGAIDTAEQYWRYLGLVDLALRYLKVDRQAARVYDKVNFRGIPSYASTNRRLLALARSRTMLMRLDDRRIDVLSLWIDFLRGIAEYQVEDPLLAHTIKELEYGVPSTELGWKVAPGYTCSDFESNSFYSHTKTVGVIKTMCKKKRVELGPRGIIE